MSRAERRVMAAWLVAAYVVAFAALAIAWMLR